MAQQAFAASLLSPSLQLISEDLRTITLITILIKAGLTFVFHDLKKVAGLQQPWSA